MNNSYLCALCKGRERQIARDIIPLILRNKHTPSQRGPLLTRNVTTTPILRSVASPLRELFDSSSKSPNTRTTSSSGLFGYPQLSNPEGHVAAAHSALQEADNIVAAVCAATTDAEIRKTVRKLDRLSDVLCSVVDLAEFLRNVHPDPSYVSAAERAVADLSNFLNQLNTHPGLYEVRLFPFEKVTQSPNILTFKRR